MTSGFLQVGVVTGVLALIVMVATGRRGALRVQRFGRFTAAALAVSAGVLIGYAVFVGWGPGGPMQHSLRPGVSYQRVLHDGAVAHLVTVDLDDDCVVVLASEVRPDGTTDGAKTISWAREHTMVAAINGGFFFPYDQSRFWDVYPNEGDEVTVLGPALGPRLGPAAEQALSDELVADWRAESATEWTGHTLVITADGRALITAEPTDEPVVAITGRHRLLQDGNLVAPHSERYPRTAVAIDAEGTTLWLVVVDGNQPGYSPGLTLAATAELLANEGASDALEMDGGGSSTMVADLGSGPEVVSRPMQVRVPGRSRVVANHLGLRVPADPSCSTESTASSTTGSSSTTGG